MRLATTVAICTALVLAPAARAETPPLPADFSNWVSEDLRLRKEAQAHHDTAAAAREAGHITAYCRAVRQEADAINQAASYSGRTLAAVAEQNSDKLTDYQQFKADDDAWANDANASVADCDSVVYMEDGTLHHRDNVMSPEWQKVYDGDLAEYERLIASAQTNADGAQQAFDNGNSLCPYLKVIVFAANQADQAADGVRGALKAAGMPTDAFDAQVGANNSGLQVYRDKYGSDCT